MQPFYFLSSGLKTGFIRIDAEFNYFELENYFSIQCKKKLHPDVRFQIKKGSKWYDIIELERCGLKFYSQKIIDVLSQFVDMSDKCYPITIEGQEDNKYYILYNNSVWLPKITPISREDRMEYPMSILLNNQMPKFFSVTNCFFYIIDEDIKQALDRAKLSNISFSPIMGYTEDEYAALKAESKVALTIE